MNEFIDVFWYLNTRQEENKRKEQYLLKEVVSYEIKKYHKH